MTNIEKLSDELSALTILEAAELVKLLEEKWNIQLNQQLPIAQNSTTEPIKNKKCTIILKSAGQKKIQVIKSIREITSLGLKEAKHLVDQAPKEIKQDIEKEEALKIKEKLEANGATIEIK